MKYLRSIIWGSVICLFLSTTVKSQSWSPGSSSLYVNPTTTKVGIGTDSPQSDLQIGSATESFISPAADLLINNNGRADIVLRNSIGNVEFSLTAGATTNYFIGRETGMQFITTGTGKTIVFDAEGGYDELTIVNGSVGIGCSEPQTALSVNGTITASRIEVVETVPCSDFVFENDYDLMSLHELDQYIKTNRHLPEVPSAEEFQKDGYSVGEMDDVLLRKIEELTLYLIDQQEEIKKLKEELDELKSE
jgi:hypothetical protein